MKNRNKVMTARELSRIDDLVRSRSPKRPASISVSGSLLEAVDYLAGPSQRSALIERALRRHLRHLVRAQRNEAELAILNAKGARLNKESDAVISDQASLDE
jgi:hypothetical protein